MKIKSFLSFPCVNLNIVSIMKEIRELSKGFNIEHTFDIEGQKLSSPY